MDFDIKAADWDNEKRVNRAKIIADEVCKVIPIKKHNKALEFGCGTGLVSFNLYDKFKSITLVDTSKGMIDKANSKINTHGVKNMTALKVDINEEPLSTDKFDVIYSSMALHHINDTEKTLERLHSMLDVGGYICIIDLNEDDGSFHKSEKGFDGHNGFNLNQLKELLHKIGFSDVSSKVIYKGVKIVGDSTIDYSLFLMSGRRQ